MSLNVSSVGSLAGPMSTDTWPLGSTERARRLLRAGLPPGSRACGAGTELSLLTRTM